jgi:predicted DNA binding protein
MNYESKTLRSFKSTVVNSRGKEVKLSFGYDASNAGHSGFYLEADIGKGYKSNKTVISAVRSLKVDALNALIDSIGTTVEGIASDFEENSKEAFINSDYAYFRLTSEEAHVLTDALVAYNSAKTKTTKNNAMKRFINSRRVAMIEMSKNTIRGIMNLHNKGITVSENVYKVELVSDAPSQYQKRDIDYVRKARVRLYENVLNKKYQPMSR